MAISKILKRIETEKRISSRVARNDKMYFRRIEYYNDYMKQNFNEQQAINNTLIKSKVKSLTMKRR